MRSALLASLLLHGALLSLVFLVRDGTDEAPAPARPMRFVAEREGMVEILEPPRVPGPVDPSPVPEPPLPRSSGPEPHVEPADRERLPDAPEPDRGAPFPTRNARLRTVLHAPSRDRARRSAAPEPPAAGRETAEPSGGRSSAPTVGPSPERLLRPEYPARALRLGLEGRVLLRVRVSRAGDVLRVVVAESSGHACLDRAAVAVARRWRFRPALRSGRPVERWYEQAVRFRLDRG